MRLRWVIALWAIVSAITPAPRAHADFHPQDRGWAGLARLIEIGRDIGVTVEAANAIAVSDLRPDDALLIVHPTGKLPTDSLGGFLRAGGRVAIADDYGNADALLRAYQIERRDLGAGPHLLLRENPAWVIALPATTHPLTQHVRGLLTNHARVVSHPALEPIFSFGEGEPAVIAGAVGEGRIVIIGDSSLFINEMLDLGDNRNFATNLLRYLAEGRSGRVLVAANDVAITGLFTVEERAPNLQAIAALLERMAKMDLPASVVHWLAAALAVFLALGAATSFPRRSPYEAPAITPSAQQSGGLIGRVEFFRDRDVNLLQPLLVYRSCLERALLAHAGLAQGAALRELIEALHVRGASKANLDGLRELLIELEKLGKSTDDLSQIPRVSEKALDEYLARGERLLALLTTQKKP